MPSTLFTTKFYMSNFHLFNAPQLTPSGFAFSKGVRTQSLASFANHHLGFVAHGMSLCESSPVTTDDTSCSDVSINTGATDSHSTCSVKLPIFQKTTAVIVIVEPGEYKVETNRLYTMYE